MLDEAHTPGNAALFYASRGLPVFPCHWIREDGECSCGKSDCTSPGKHPLTQRGCLDASTDPDRITEWWRVNPSANIGMATGEPSGLWVLDIEADGRRDWAAVIANEEEDVPYSPVSQTGGGGQHLFFKLNGEVITNRVKLGGHLIDCRGKGGYVLLPPSNHVSGSTYSWIRSLDEAEPEEAPEWLVSFVTAGGSARGGESVCQASGFDNAPRSSRGSRHNDLARLVGKEFARGRQYGDVLTDALNWGKRCDPPHDEADIRRVVSDIASREFSRLQAAKSGEVSPAAEPFSLSLLTSSEFETADFAGKFLVKRVLVAGQPCIVGGPKKTLKTSFLVDLGISLGTGTPFLGTFAVPERVNVGILSGESGGFTLKETAKRIALSKGVTLSGSSTHWCFDLPMLSRPDHLQALADIIRERQLEAVIIDPAYLCLLDGGMAEAAGNVFRMGNVLRQVAEVGAETECTLILAHHSTKAAGRSYEPMELEDLSQAGFAEFARQWLLLSRREAFEYGTGQHKLWLSVGGSAGHSGLYGVDVDEGVLADDFSGRKWEVDVVPACKLIANEAAAAAEQKRMAAENALRSRREAIAKTMQRFPDGETKTTIRAHSPLNSANFSTTFAMLIEDGTVIPCKVTKANGRPYDGYKLATGTPGTGTGDSNVPVNGAHTGDTPLFREGCPGVCVSGGATGTAEGVPAEWEF